MKLADFLGFTTDIEQTQQSKMPRAYKPEKDILANIQQICSAVYSDLRERYERQEKSMSYRNWNVSPKLENFCNVSVHGDKIAFKVYQLSGGHRVPKASPQDLQSKGRETKRFLDEFVRDFKKEFKRRTGANLVLSETSDYINWELVERNGLYRFIGIKSGYYKANLEGQKWPTNSEDIDKEPLE